MEHLEPPHKPDLARLAEPVPWRPALQIGDTHRPLPKPALRALIRAAERGR